MFRCLSLLKCSMYRSELLEHLKLYIIFRYNLSRNHHLGQSQITTTLHPINSHVVGMLQHDLCFWPCNVCILKVNKFYSIDPRSSLTPTCTKRMNRREKCPRRHQSWRRWRTSRRSLASGCSTSSHWGFSFLTSASRWVTSPRTLPRCDDVYQEVLTCSNRFLEQCDKIWRNFATLANFLISLAMFWGFIQNFQKI